MKSGSLRNEIGRNLWPLVFNLRMDFRLEMDGSSPLRQGSYILFASLSCKEHLGSFRNGVSNLISVIQPLHSWLEALFLDGKWRRSRKTSKATWSYFYRQGVVYHMSILFLDSSNTCCARRAKMGLANLLSCHMSKEKNPSGPTFLNSISIDVAKTWWYIRNWWLFQQRFRIERVVLGFAPFEKTPSGRQNPLEARAVFALRSTARS